MEEQQAGDGRRAREDDGQDVLQSRPAVTNGPYEQAARPGEANRQQDQQGSHA
jgi:hypothetical protein